jgi:hypothetical protein
MKVPVGPCLWSWKCEPVEFGLYGCQQPLARMLGAEVDPNVEVPATDCDPQEPLLDTRHRLSLPAMVDTEVA